MKKYRALIAVFVCAVMLILNSCSYATFSEIVGDKEETTTYHYNENVHTDNGTTSVAVTEQTTSAVIQEITTSIVVPEQTTAAIIPQETTTTEPVIENTTAVTVQQTTSAPVPDYSSYTKGQILKVYSDALQKTRGYMGAVSVNHSESFTADIKDAHPGGALTELLASNIVKLVGSEGQQTLNFINGYATNKDNERVPLLLPQRASFSLPEQGLAEAQISGDSGKTYVRLVIVPETVSMGEVPPYNASAIGYLDTSDMEFKIITISRVDISYPGSVIDAVINSDGLIEGVTYTIKMSTYAELSGMGVSGYGTLEGAQTESWRLNY